MLSGEGNAGEQWKITIGLISIKATLHVQHTFFVHFFAVVLRDYNVTHVLWRKFLTCSFIACVASVSLRFRSKERGTRVKDRAKNGTSKRAERGWGRKEGNACRQTPGFWNPSTWPPCLSARTYIWCCQQLSIFVLQIQEVLWRIN